MLDYRTGWRRLVFFAFFWAFFSLSFCMFFWLLDLMRCAYEKTGLVDAHDVENCLGQSTWWPRRQCDPGQ